jgi:hypothetical protein
LFSGPVSAGLPRFRWDWWYGVDAHQYADSLDDPEDPEDPANDNTKILQRHWIGVTPMDAELVRPESVPLNRNYACTYARKYVRVAAAYELPVTVADRSHSPCCSTLVHPDGWSGFARDVQRIRCASRWLSDTRRCGRRLWVQRFVEVYFLLP